MEEVLYIVLCGGIGALVAGLLGKVIRSKHLLIVCVAAGMMTGAEVGKPIGVPDQPFASGVFSGFQLVSEARADSRRVPASKIPEVVEIAVEGWKKYRAFQLLFETYPETEGIMRARITEMLEKHPANEAFERSRDISNEVMAKYFKQHEATGSDEATLALLQHQLDYMRSLEDTPVHCIGYFLGAPKLSQDEIDPVLLERELKLKAAILETSLANPSPPPEPVDEEKVIGMLLDSYDKNGLDIQSIFILEEATTRNRADAAACQAAIIYVRAMLAMDEKDAAYVVKSMMMME